MSTDDAMTERFDNVGDDGHVGAGGVQPTPRKSRTGLIVGGVLVAVVVVGGIVAASLVGATNGDGDAAGTTPPSPVATVSGAPSGPSQTPGPTASAPSTDNASGAVDQVTLPTDCQAIYTPELWNELTSATNLPLNHPGVVSNEQFTTDDDVNALLAATDKLKCTWGAPSDAGIITWVAEVTPEQSAEAVRKLEASGNTCGEQLGGTRCTQEFRDEESGAGVAGYSHVLRGNLWIATHWVNVAPEGYSESIVTALFS